MRKMFRTIVAKQIAKAASVKEEDVLALLEVPPDQKLGDLAFPCFTLAKKLKKAPQQIAAELAAKISDKKIQRAEAAGPYLNIYLDRKSVAEQTLTQSVGGGEKKEVILLEYPSPNTNKPLHLGHLRNMLIGSATANICEAAGHKVVRTNLYNDRGIGTCQSMLAYMRWGENSTPESLGMRSDQFVGHWYVRFKQEANKDAGLEEEARELLRRWEAGDLQVRKVWEQLNRWTYQGYEATFKRLQLVWDATYHESDIYQEGKRVVEEGLAKGVFMRDEKDNVVADLGALGTKVLLRADNTTVYMTQDLYLAKLRQEEFGADAQVYVVGEEQKLHFQQLFKTLQLLGYPHTDKLHHLWYGLISLPEGRMKSREGTVVDAEDLLDEMEELAAKAVRERHLDLTAEDLAKRARAIGHGALKYFVLKYEPKTAFTYNPAESLSFEGDTGPYLQYAIVRINSILAEANSTTKPDAEHLVDEEAYALIRLLAETNAVVEEASEQYKSHLVARHAMAIAQAFTIFYHNHHVLSAPEAVKAARAALLKATKEHLTFLLGLLGIEPLEEM
jgi:arginyl-tRNA synthetase